MTLDIHDMTEAIRKKIGEDCGLKKRIKFILSDGKVIFVDASVIPNLVSNEDQEADCVIKTSTENLHKIMLREVDATTSYFSGKIKIEGDMGIALKVTRIL